MNWIGSVLTLALGAMFGPIGLIAGQLISSLLFKPKDMVTEGNRLSEFSVQNSQVGSVIPYIVGEVKVGGNVIWHEGFKENKHRKKVADGGKGGSDQYVDEYYYSNKIAFAISRNELAGFKRIWLDGKLAYSYDGKDRDIIDENYSQYFTNQTINDVGYISQDSSDGSGSSGGILSGGSIFFSKGGKKEGWQVRFYNGSEEQEVNPIIKAKEGNSTPSFKGLSYFFFEFSDLTEWGHRIPKMQAVVVEKSFDNNIEVIDSNDSITITEDDYTICDYNFFSAYKFLYNTRENYDYVYAWTPQYGLSYFNRTMGSTKQDVVLYRSKYEKQNDEITDQDDFYRVNYDNRLYIEQNSIYMINGEKDIRFSKEGFEVINRDYDFSTPAYSVVDELGTYSKVETNSFYYSNFMSQFNEDYENNIKFGSKTGTIISASNQYKVFFVYEDLREYNGYEGFPKSLPSKNLIYIETNNDTYIFDKIEGRDVVTFFYYNSINPVIATSNESRTKLYIYVLNIFYDQDIKGYNYNYYKIRELNISNFNQNDNNAVQTFDINCINNEDINYRRYAIPSQNFSLSKKYYYDPRFNIFIELFEFIPGSNRIMQHELNFYKITESNDIEFIKSENAVIKENINTSNYTYLTTCMTFNRGLNLVTIFNNEDSKLEINEKQISYFKGGELADDFITFLDDVVKRLLLESAYTEDEIDVSELEGIQVSGYIYGNSDTARAHIDKLRTAYQFDIVEEDFKIKAKKRGKGYVREFNAQQIGFESDTNYENSVAYNVKIASSVELPTTISLNYASINNAFENSVQKSEIIAEHSKDEVLDLPLALIDNEAKRITDILLTVAHREIENYSFNLSLDNIDLNVSDVVILNIDQGDEIVKKYVRITNIDLDEFSVKVQAVSDNLNSYKSNATATKSEGGIIQEEERTGISDLLMFNAVSLNNELFEINKPNFYAISLPRNNEVIASNFYDAGSIDLVDEDTPQVSNSVVWGRLVESNEILNKGFDKSELKIRFVNNNNNLQNVTKNQLFEDKYLNLIAIITNTNVEFIQYKDYTVDSNIVTLTNLLRERFNSYSVKALEGSRVVLLTEDNIISRSLNLNRIGTNHYAKLTSGFNDLSSVDIDTINITGENLKPHQVVDLNVDVESNNVIISYKPVVNSNGEWESGRDVDYSYLTFNIQLFNNNEELEFETETKDLSYTFDNTVYTNIKYIKVTAINDNNDLQSREVTFDIDNANIITTP